VIRQHGDFSVPDDIEAPLWRYIGMDKLEDLVTTSELFFARVDRLGDAFEGSHSAAAIARRPRIFEGATERYINESLPNETQQIRHVSFASCWHNMHTESTQMWSLYAAQGRGVAVRSSLQRLTHGILDTEREFCLRPMEYLDYGTDETPWGNVIWPMFCKRAEFLHEREFRILVPDFDLITDLSAPVPLGGFAPEGIRIPVDLAVLIQEIVVAPGTNAQTFDRVSRLASSASLDDRVRKSTLEERPKF
jgi:hypothetical protein